MRNEKRKDIEHYIEQGVNKKPAHPLNKDKTNWIAVVFIAAALLTTLILISC